MPRYYKGAGVGTYWETHDARGIGFFAQAPHLPANIVNLRDHIVIGVTLSPYISLTQSYLVARHYAVNGPIPPAPARPAYVYVIDIPDQQFSSFNFVDPVQRIATLQTPQPGLRPYRHHGPPIMTTGFLPYLPPLLQALLYAERDAEILAMGPIPAGYVGRYRVL